MTTTIFQEENEAFSDAAHLAAQRQFYPYLFGSKDLQFESVKLKTSIRNTILDGELGIDRIVRVRQPKLRLPLPFSVQERFRRQRFMAHEDITITEWNWASNEKGELYKLLADFFVYGYYAAEENIVLDVVAVQVVNLKFALLRDRIPYQMGGNKKEQSFLTIKFGDLNKVGVLRARMV